MVVECLVIIAILFAMIVFFWKVKREQAIAVFPLLTLPAVNIISHIFMEKLVVALNWDILLTYVIFIVVSVVISSVFIGFLSGKLLTRSVKIGYFVMSVIFNVFLAIILISNTFTIYM